MQHPSAPRLLASLLGSLLSLAGPAEAAPTLVVEDAADAVGVERARDRVQLLAGVDVPEDRVFGRDELLTTLLRQPLVDGDVQAGGCAGLALARTEFDARVAEAAARLQRLDLEGAEASWQELEGDLPCATFVLAPEPLADLLLLGGAIATRREDPDTALSRFGAAASIEPGRPPADLPPEAQSLQRRAQGTAATAPTSLVALLPSEAAHAAWLDGRSLDPRGEEIPVPSGAHLLQVEVAAGALRGVSLQVDGDGLWADPGAAVAAVLAGGGRGVGATAAHALLARAGARWGAETIYVAFDRSLFVWGDEPGDAPGDEVPRVPLLPTGDRLGLRLGGGLLVREEEPGTGPQLFGAPGLELDVALVRGLEVGASVAVGFSAGVDGSTAALPAADLGLQWAWAGARVRPWIGLRGALAVVATGEPRGGASAWLGVRLHPSDRAPLRVGVALGFGWVGAVQAQARITLGFGVGSPSGDAPPGGSAGRRPGVRASNPSATVRRSYPTSHQESPCPPASSLP